MIYNEIQPISILKEWFPDIHFGSHTDESTLAIVTNCTLTDETGAKTYIWRPVSEEEAYYDKLGNIVVC